jgi:hypothetical protein
MDLLLLLLLFKESTLEGSFFSGSWGSLCVHFVGASFAGRGEAGFAFRTNVSEPTGACVIFTLYKLPYCIQSAIEVHRHVEKTIQCGRISAKFTELTHLWCHGVSGQLRANSTLLINSNRMQGSKVVLPWAITSNHAGRALSNQCVLV